MSRLPVPGDDVDVWGEILNDFLSVEHNSDGTLKLASTIAAKADDSTVVHNSGSETVAGVKTFTSSPVVPDPTLASQAASKSYVDATASAGAADATTSSKGIVQLAGDLGGTAAAPTVPGLSTKEPAITAGTNSQYWRGDKSWQTLDKTAVGLGNVDNTSDVNKPISTATQTALNAKADKTTTITAGIGLSGGGDLSANRTFNVSNDTTTQRIRLSENGSLVGTRQELNLIEGSNITLTPADDGPNNRVNVTVASAAPGETNTASNVNVGGVGVFKQKTGVNFEFRGINAGSNKVTATLDSPNNDIDIDVVEGNFSGIPQSAVSNLASALSAKEDTANKGATNGYASLDAGAKVPTAQLPTVALLRSYQFSNTGTLGVATGTHRLYNDSGATWTIQSVRASVGTAPSGASIIIDINVSGTTIFTTQANRPTIAAAGNTSGKITNYDVTTVANGSYLTVDVDQIGSTTAGADLSVQVEVA